VISSGSAGLIGPEAWSIPSQAKVSGSLSSCARGCKLSEATGRGRSNRGHASAHDWLGTEIVINHKSL
jgi:hypothetical protein